MTDSTAPVYEPPTVEWWYNIAHLIFGVVYLGSVPILVPTYVIQETNSAVAAGVVMAIIGLGALFAPVIGGFADKYLAHRQAQLGVWLRSHSAGYSLPLSKKS